MQFGAGRGAEVSCFALRTGEHRRCFVVGSGAHLAGMLLSVEDGAVLAELNELVPELRFAGGGGGGLLLSRRAGRGEFLLLGLDFSALRKE